MADPKSKDPIARESTRLWCAAVMGAQTSLDPKELKEWTPNSRYGGHAFGFMDPMETVAGEFPDTIFIHISGYKSNTTNFGNLFGAMENPGLITFDAAILVVPAPVVNSPKTISSATRPPISTASRALALYARGDRTSAGRRPRCSCPAWGSKVSHTKSPASGT